MQEDEESVIDYAKLKEKAHDRETWRQWERTCLCAENTNNNLRIPHLTQNKWHNFWLIKLKSNIWLSDGKSHQNFQKPTVFIEVLQYA